jgi:hypothetical protein
MVALILAALTGRSVAEFLLPKSSAAIAPVRQPA